MGLKARIEASRRRKAIRFAIEQTNGERALVKAIVKSNDGGLLAHVATEQGA